MSFLFLAALLSGIYGVVNTWVFPGALDPFEYWSGMVLCFVAARVFGSKARDPAVDDAFVAVLKLLIPLGGLGFIGYGIWLWNNNEPVAEAGDQAYAVTGTYDSAIMLASIALGVCLLLMTVQMYRRR